MQLIQGVLRCSCSVCVRAPWVRALFDVSNLLMQCGWTAVHVSAYNGHLAVVKELIESCGCSSDGRDKVCLYVFEHCPLLFSRNLCFCVDL